MKAQNKDTALGNQEKKDTVAQESQSKSQSRTKQQPEATKQAPKQKQSPKPQQELKQQPEKTDSRPVRSDSMPSSSASNTRQQSGYQSGNRQHDRQYRSRSRDNRDNNGARGHHRQQRQDNRSRDQRGVSQLKLYEQKKIPLEDLSLVDLNFYSRRLGIVGASLLRKSELVERIKQVEANPDMEMEVQGVLERLPDGFGFLRSAAFDYVSGPDDVYVSPSQIRRFNLKTGDTVSGVIRKPKEGEKYFALLKVNKVNNDDPVKLGDRMSFDRLSPLHPDKKLSLEDKPTAISTRIMDLFTPIGKGQRGLIVAPPKVGKTVLLKEIAQSLIANNPDSYLMVLLVDERPEEVADMKRAVKGAHAQVVSSTFDEAADRHVQVAELVLEKAKRMVEGGQHVIILLDSITRLARAYNTTAPASGKVLTGGIDANALHRPKRFFGAARNTQEGGSLTIIATALVDTGSRMDEVIYEEFKGTGNMEMHMTRKLSNRRIYPAFDLLQSGTRRDDLLQGSEDLKKVWVLQKFLASMNTIEGMEFLINKMKKHKTNQEFLDALNKKAGSDS